MKKLIFTGLLLPALLFAQTYGGYSREELEPLILQAQNCMQQLDQQELAKLQVEAMGVMAETEQLCAAGERDAAQEESIAYARQALKEPLVKEWQQCMGVLGQTLPLLALLQMQNPEATDTHVCDLPERFNAIP